MADSHFIVGAPGKSGSSPPTGRRSSYGARGAVLAVAAAILGGGSVTGCGGPPEQCHGCLAMLVDGGALPMDTSASSGGNNGNGSGGGGVIEPGSGGTVGPVGTGGTPGSGGIGTSGTGGSGLVPGTGGVGNGGAAATGGTAAGTGGAASGGAPAASGGAPAGTGGASTGGAPAGTGGAAPGSGGAGTGGAPVGTGGAPVGTGGAPVGTGGAPTDPDLVLWYKFDEASGSSAADSAMAGGVARNATLKTAGTGTATFSSTHQVGTHAVSLVGTSATAGGYVALPSLQSLAPTATTIAAWVNLSANGTAQNWERVFDFGVSATVNMFLTARTGTSPNGVRFAITTGGGADTAEQRLSSTSTLSASAWHHLAVVLQAGATYTGRLYIDGVEAATNTAMTLHPTDLGATTANYLGRSQYASDPYFSGLVDDFRVYKRALTAAEISTLFAVR